MFFPTTFQTPVKAKSREEVEFINVILVKYLKNLKLAINSKILNAYSIPNYVLDIFVPLDRTPENKNYCPVHKNYYPVHKKAKTGERRGRSQVCLTLDFVGSTTALCPLPS